VGSDPTVLSLGTDGDLATYKEDNTSHSPISGTLFVPSNFGRTSICVVVGLATTNEGNPPAGKVVYSVTVDSVDRGGEFPSPNAVTHQSQPVSVAPASSTNRVRTEVLRVPFNWGLPETIVPRPITLAASMQPAGTTYTAPTYVTGLVVLDGACP
jgi:hypothetical protein